MPETLTVRVPDTKEDFVHALIDFIQGPLCARHGAGAGCIDASTPLFETGVIDSLGIIDLLVFVERATGKPVPVRKVDMRFFGTIDRIAETFWSEARTS
jgi:acyl carrier protein